MNTLPNMTKSKYNYNYIHIWQTNIYLISTWTELKCITPEIIAAYEFVQKSFHLETGYIVWIPSQYNETICARLRCSVAQICFDPS